MQANRQAVTLIEACIGEAFTILKGSYYEYEPIDGFSGCGKGMV